MKIVVVTITVVIVIALSIYFIFIKNRNSNINIIVQNGIYVKGRKNSNGTDAYFKGNNHQMGTVLMGKSLVRSITFRELGSSKTQTISFQDCLYIGRSKTGVTDSVLLLKEDALVSKLHCMIYESGGRFVIMDMNSKNHTFLNGNRIDTAVYIKKGDILQVGNTRLEVL